MLPMHFPIPGELEIALPAQLLPFPTVERRFWKKHCRRLLRGWIPERSASMLNKKTGKKHLLSRIQGIGCDSGVLNGKAAASWFYLSQQPA